MGYKNKVLGVEVNSYIGDLLYTLYMRDRLKFNSCPPPWWRHPCHPMYNTFKN